MSKTISKENKFFAEQTDEQIGKVWQEILAEALKHPDPAERDGTQNHHTVIWLFFGMPKDAEGKLVSCNASMYMHPNFPGFFHFPVPNGTSIQTVKEYLEPILRDGFVYEGYST
jgi:hypothetical protein